MTLLGGGGGERKGVPQRLKPQSNDADYGTAEAVPLSKTAREWLGEAVAGMRSETVAGMRGEAVAGMRGEAV